jgi:hypothetical protein
VSKAHANQSPVIPRLASFEPSETPEFAPPLHIPEFMRCDALKDMLRRSWYDRRAV